MIENIRLSFKGILSHKIRSFLTMLGIIIGIAAIIAIVSTIKGTNEQIKNNLIGAGNNTVKIQLSNGDTVCDFSYEAPPSNVAMFTPDTKKRINELKEVESSTFYRTDRKRLFISEFLRISEPAHTPLCTIHSAV